MPNMLIPILLLGSMLLLNGSSVHASNGRKVELTYTATVQQIPEDTGQITVWIPLPRSSRHQKVSEIRIDSPFQWEVRSEPEFGNEYLVATIDDPEETLSATITLEVERRTVLLDRLGPETVPQDELRRNLRPDGLVVMSPRIRTIANQVTQGRQGTLDEARAIYDYVVRTAGSDAAKANGERNVSHRSGELEPPDGTELHSLFIALARARGIPARFVTGFAVNVKEPVPVSEHRSWAQFYLEGKGWVPVDASAATKSRDPAVQNFLFGNLDFDRIELNVGADIQVTPPTHQPLSLFVAPHAEADGKAVGVASATAEFVSPPPARPPRQAGGRSQ